MHADYKLQQAAAEVASFQIDSTDRANWLVRRLVECRSYAVRARAFAERERRRAEREERALMRRFGRQLEAWVSNEIAARGGRRKSVSLPAGTVGYRTRKAMLVVDNTTAVLDWARQHCPEAVLTAERLSMSAIASAMKVKGVIPDKGAHVEPEGQRLFIR